MAKVLVVTSGKGGKNLDAIRDINAPLFFPVVPDGHAEHLRYSFARVEREGARDGQRR